jgi:hypothetical protein
MGGTKKGIQPVVTKEDLNKAKEYSKLYEFPLVKEWTGYKLFQHVWHRPKIYYPMTYDKYIDRVIEIAEEKPQEERAERFQLMIPSSYAARVKAYAARDKAYAAWVKADAARDKAYAAWVKADAAWVKAYAAWVKTDEKNIIASHAKDCPNCKWEGDSIDGCLPQFN